MIQNVVSIHACIYFIDERWRIGESGSKCITRCYLLILYYIIPRPKDDLVYIYKYKPVTNNFEARFCPSRRGSRRQRNKINTLPEFITCISIYINIIFCSLIANQLMQINKKDEKSYFPKRRGICWFKELIKYS